MAKKPSVVATLKKAGSSHGEAVKIAAQIEKKFGKLKPATPKDKENGAGY